MGLLSFWTVSLLNKELWSGTRTMKRKFCPFGNKVGKTHAALFLELLIHYPLPRKLLPAPLSVVCEVVDVPQHWTRRHMELSAVGQHQQFQLLCYPHTSLCIIQAHKSVDFYLSFYFLARPAIRKNYIKNMKVTSSLPSFRYLLQEHREASVDIKIQLNRFC